MIKSARELTESKEWIKKFRQSLFELEIQVSATKSQLESLEKEIQEYEKKEASH